MTVYYMKYDDGSLGTLDIQGLPSLPKPGVYVTQAEYNDLKAVQSAADAAAATAIRAAEDTANRLKFSGGTRVVASVTAPARVKATAAYVCDGTQDQVQINQAITDTLAEGGGTVRLSAGEFMLGDNILVPQGSSLTIEGSGWGTSVRTSAASNRYAFNFTGPGSTTVTIRDMVINGDHTAQTTSGGGIWASNAVQCHFENLRFTGCFDESIHFGEVSASVDGGGNRITACLFDGTDTSLGKGTGIHFSNSPGNFVTGCSFTDMGGAVGLAAGVFDESGQQTIADCTFTNGRSGIPAVRLKDCDATRVLGTAFDSVAGTAVHVAGSGHVLVANTILNVGADSSPGTSSGVHLEFAAKNCVVSGNHMTTHPTNGAAMSLIRESGEGSAGGNLIHGNTLLQQGTVTVALLDLQGAGSTVRDNTGAGVFGHEAGPVKLVAGAVTDASFPAVRPPASGTIAVDTTNNRLYAKVGGTWKYAALT